MSKPNHEYRLLLPASQLQSGSRLTSDLSSVLSRCPSDIYLLIKQPSVGVADFSSSTSAPALSKCSNHATDTRLRSRTIIPEVIGEVDIRLIEQELNRRCGASSIAIDVSTIASSAIFDDTPQVLSLNFSAPSESQPERGQDILDHDASLSLILDMLRNRNYTVLYTTTPAVPASHVAGTPKQYEMYSYDESLHTELKRDVDSEPVKVRNNQTLVDGPLFEKYQFLTPGLFMGLLVSFLLLSILYVAISGVASLQVSYAAFDKENGPSGQKKVQ
ncbi:hypothetical protein EPUS_06901 [Endocarpon pusillum Z07020]|uniref:Protein BIG1 n=1 Tax=Endocarpon pusillum (strain Z07020 / HMAS-L-300199) TaxID=1263415 RepID=U1HDK0_ENDPU|nr:uncharacterized protein EPUS_06901 [Endocarpon pusillum Z07020]ERF68090.1 hypothetical protein EPUS_06901 [Endocarpon pusillum Z07020]